MDQSRQDKLELLLAPVSEAQPAGSDLGYSPLFDQIREARRADDPVLSQGDWAASLKSADWPKTRKLCEDALIGQSKDLQLAVWYVEALTRIDGYAGLDFGLRFVAGLLQRYWETAYPELDPDDLDERVGKLEWLNTQLGRAIRQVPLIPQAHGGYDWYRWQESREVENLGLRDGEARERAIAEGKLSGEVFDKAAQYAGLPWFQTLSEQLTDARDAYAGLDSLCDERFGYAAPNLAEIREAINAASDVVNRLFEQFGGRAAATPAGETQPVMNTTPHDAPATPTATPQALIAAGPIASRADAIRQLRDIARFFRANEPHSPVALLAERAAKWAEMPLEDWLQTVIKDDSTLGQLRELLDFRQA
ncbi:type VI secretion system protein TssA [Chitiniphilus eburneus]|uniref:Type VI secretion system protein TssA n=1 Tax=Chitiniphilus eburneus TaxID=2571148 RepID=A0A4U0PUU6_9NEIS|nr:type VI secretion system protein TssA [Chitiniphilus eburneus]TJZ66844.1 type VI secretion system protein TssA [Chitiniphilus eburneus]